MNNLTVLNNKNEVNPVSIKGITGIFTSTLTDNTKRAYRTDIMQFFNVKDMSDITMEMIKNVDPSTATQYALKLAKEGKANSTINRKLTSLSAFYTFLCSRAIGVMDYNPFSKKEGAKRIKQDKTYSNTRALTKEEVQKLFRVIQKDNNIITVRDRIIVSLLATTGMRREEIVNIKVGDITIQMGKHVVEIEGKGGKPRYITVTNNIIDLIKKYLSMRGLTMKDKDKPLLTRHTSNSDYHANTHLSSQTVYRTVKKISDEAGIDASSISPHSLRHTFITQSLLLGRRIEDVQDMAGHSDVSTTRRYDHVERVISRSTSEELENMFS